MYFQNGCLFGFLDENSRTRLTWTVRLGCTHWILWWRSHRWKVWALKETQEKGTKSTFPPVTLERMSVALSLLFFFFYLNLKQWIWEEPRDGIPLGTWCLVTDCQPGSTKHLIRLGQVKHKHSAPETVIKHLLKQEVPLAASLHVNHMCPSKAMPSLKRISEKPHSCIDLVQATGTARQMSVLWDVKFWLCGLK